MKDLIYVFHFKITFSKCHLEIQTFVYETEILLLLSYSESNLAISFSTIQRHDKK